MYHHDVDDEEEERRRADATPVDLGGGKSDEVLDAIRAIDEELIGRPPTPRDWRDRETPVSESEVLERFDGSWDDALVAAGRFRASHRAGHVDILEQLEAVEETNEALTEEGVDRHPTLFEVVDHTGIDPDEFLLVFDTWFHVVRGTFGEQQLEPEHITEDEVIRDVERIARKLSRPPSITDVDEWGAYPRVTYHQTVGLIDDMYELMDDELLPTKAELVEELELLASELDGSPTMVDVNEHSQYPYKVFFIHWDTWSDILEDVDLSGDN